MKGFVLVSLLACFSVAQGVDFRRDPGGSLPDLALAGDVKSIEDFPYHVTIYDASERHPYRVRCGGVILHPKIILTSATCTAKIIDAAIRAGSRTICTGFIFESCESGITLDKLNFVAERANWTGSNPRMSNVALIKLHDPLPMPTGTMKAAILPISSELSNSGKVGNVTGHGTDPKFDAKGVTPILKWSQVEVKEQKLCKDIFKEEFDESTMFCASRKETMVCSIDDGGGFIYRFSNETNKFVVLGISNYPVCPETQEGFSLYTKVHAFNFWIRGAVKNWLTDEEKLEFLNTNKFSTHFGSLN